MVIMRKIYKILACFLAIPFILTPCISIAEEDTKDLFASVIVLPTFDITLDNNYLDFGLVEPGETVTLKEGAYYNEIKCSSNKGVKYYIKTYILGEIIGSKQTKIPPSSFKWKVYDASGSGIAISEWQEFSDKPILVYTSGLEDEIGSAVVIQFQYKLDLPAKARGGHYSLNVAYILTEEEW